MSEPICKCGHTLTWHYEKSYICHYCECKEFQDARIATLEAQLAEAKRDSERLEWMIDNGGRVASWEEDRHRVEYLGVYGQMAADWCKTPREAIDAAIEAAKEEQ